MTLLLALILLFPAPVSAQGVIHEESVSVLPDARVDDRGASVLGHRFGRDGAGVPLTDAIAPATLGGVASWYDDGPGLYGAAGPVLRDALGGDPAFRGKRVTVCGNGDCVAIVLSDWCACGDRGGRPTVVDLSRQAFARLADPSVGVLAVTITIDAAPRGTLPPTSTLPMLLGWCWT